MAVINFKANTNWDATSFGLPANDISPGTGKYMEIARKRLFPLYGGPWPWLHKAVIIGQPAIAPTAAVGKNPLDHRYGPLGSPINPTVQPALAGKIPALGW